jgi:protein subunit release factor A
MQVNDDNDAIIELRNKIKNQDDPDMTKLLKGEIKEIKKRIKEILIK